MYPHLTEIIFLLAADNGTTNRLLPSDEWQWPENVKLLESSASSLDDEDKEVFAAGDADEIVEMTEDNLDLQLLSKWLNGVFNRNPKAGRFFSR
jgi:hypothetical protein